MSDVDQDGRRGSRSTVLLTLLAAVLAIGGLLAIGGFVWAQPQSPPQPPAAVAAATAPASSAPSTQSAPSTASTPSTSPSPTPTTLGPVLARSKPVTLDIKSIGVHSTLMTLGTNADGSVQVPSLLGGAPAGWYRGSPTPGQLGPAVILGHVDDDKGPAVFYDLGALKPGAKVSVTRADHSVAVFKISKVASYYKDQFPTLEVYGNTYRAELRLITCGGTFNKAIGHYDHNIVAYATLVSSHPA